MPLEHIRELEAKRVDKLHFALINNKQYVVAVNAFKLG